MTKKIIIPILIFSAFMLSSCGRGQPTTIDLPDTPIELENPGEIDLSSPSYNLELNENLKTTPDTENVCPDSEWVNCMPGPDVGARPNCEPEFLEWAKDNCPNFQGAAY